MNQPVVLITGALTGIGRATAFAFARAGARLVVSGRRAAEGAALEAELREAGAEALFVKADVRHDEDVRNVVDQTVARYGRLDVAVNNAAGSIVNISSTYGHEGAAFASVYAGSKHAVEGITKSAALEVASTGVRVNAVAPGPTDTGMLDRFTSTAENKAALASKVPLARIGKPDDIAAAVLYLAAEGAAFVTGQILTVDGGKTAG